MPDYQHLLRMTDECGILQFSRLSYPDPLSGYTLDDNARALMVTLNMENGHNLALRYATWLFQAQRPDGSWCNLQINGKDIRALDSEDSIGRAMLACCLGIACQWEDVQILCRTMLSRNLPATRHFRSPRAVAYTLTGLCKLQAPLSRDQLQLINHHKGYLIHLYRHQHKARWHWFEDMFTYCNGILPQSLFSAYLRTADKKALKAGHDALNFLCDLLFQKGYLNIIGNKNWYSREGKMSRFDQQPVDAASTAFACLEAYQTIGGQEYLELALKAYNWYYGANINQVQLYDSDTGGCFDAITEDGVNLNQGAEAVLSLLLSEQHIATHLQEKSQPSPVEQTS